MSRFEPYFPFIIMAKSKWKVWKPLKTVELSATAPKLWFNWWKFSHNWLSFHVWGIYLVLPLSHASVLSNFQFWKSWEVMNIFKWLLLYYLSVPEYSKVMLSTSSLVAKVSKWCASWCGIVKVDGGEFRNGAPKGLERISRASGAHSALNMMLSQTPGI